MLRRAVRKRRPSSSNRRAGRRRLLAEPRVVRSSEREFGNLKHNFGLAFLRVRGIERVRLHADVCILARLALALERARSAPRAA